MLAMFDEKGRTGNKAFTEKESASIERIVIQE